MRIGRTVIDTDNMSVEECSILITELRKIRARKVKAEELSNKMCTLLAEADANGFSFLDKDSGYILKDTDFVLWEKQ